MLIIRKEQTDAFRNHAQSQFETRMVAHLRKFFPNACQPQPEEALRDFIRYGIDRAMVYDINRQKDVCKYIDLMITFGQDFDVDPQLPWASKILNRKRQPGTATKMDRLFKEALQQIKSKET